MNKSRTTAHVLRAAGLQLATLRFVNRTMHNRGESYTYHRDGGLYVHVVQSLYGVCAACRAEIEPGQVVAEKMFVRYCLGCVAWMTPAEANQTITTYTEPPTITPAVSIEYMPMPAPKKLILLVKEIRHTPIVQERNQR